MSLSFAAIVRTTGIRPSGLLCALESIAFQAEPCLAVVVVHGDADAKERVEQTCRSVEGLQFVLLHAADVSRRRGYPINVGFDYVRDQAGIHYAFLLDDDDLIYPFFTREMLASFSTSDADVVYAASNRLDPESGMARGFEPRPILAVLRGNFIATNSYAIRMEKFRAAPVRADEELEYLEDWLFLIEMLKHGFRFEPNALTLSEFSMHSDGNREQKKDRQAWETAMGRVREEINRSKFPIAGGQIVGLLEDLNPRVSPEPAAPSSNILIARLEARVADLERSWSWRVSLPIRIAGSAAIKLRALVARNANR